MSEMQNAPTGENEGVQESISADDSSRPPREAVNVNALRARAAGYALLVENPAGKYRRRLFLTLASAQRAKDRANERGQYAAIVLVRITPVTGGGFL